MARSGTPLHVRVTDEERATIKKRAATAGVKVSEYVRLAALGDLPTSPPSTGKPSKARSARPAAEGRTSDSSSSIAAAKSEPPPTPIKGGVEGEVEEATLRDAPAHEHFLERRTRELVGQGKTTKVARSLAEAEWRRRGTDDEGPRAA